MKLLDLFSGIGGFSLAASWAYIETCKCGYRRVWIRIPDTATSKGNWKIGEWRKERKKK